MVEWLTFDSVVQLDTAFCHKLLRRELFELYRSDDLVVKSEIHLSLEVMKWLKARSLKVAHITLKHPFRKWEGDGEQLSAFVELCAPVLRTVNCGKFSLPRGIAKHRLNMTHLSANVAEDMESELKALKNNPDLRRLSIATDGTYKLNKRVFKGIVLPTLEVLTLTTFGVFPRGFESAVSMNKNLPRLDLRSTIHYQSYLAFRSCSNLRALRVAKLDVKVDTWSIIGSQCPLIQHLELRHPQGFDCESVLRMVQNLRHLRSICVDYDMDATLKLGRQTLQHLGDHCADTLEFVHLHSRYFSAPAVTAFRQRCTKLVSFHITYAARTHNFPNMPTSVTAFRWSTHWSTHHTELELSFVLKHFCFRFPLVEVLELDDVKAGELCDEQYLTHIMTKCPNLRTLVVGKHHLPLFEWARRIYPQLKVVTESVLDFSNALNLPLSC